MLSEKSVRLITHAEVREYIVVPVKVPKFLRDTKEAEELRELWKYKLSEEKQRLKGLSASQHALIALGKAALLFDEVARDNEHRGNDMTCSPAIVKAKSQDTSLHPSCAETSRDTNLLDETVANSNHEGVSLQSSSAGSSRDLLSLEKPVVSSQLILDGHKPDEGGSSQANTSTAFSESACVAQYVQHAPMETMSREAESDNRVCIPGTNANDERAMGPALTLFQQAHAPKVYRSSKPNPRRHIFHMPVLPETTNSNTSEVS